MCHTRTYYSSVRFSECLFCGHCCSSKWSGWMAYEYIHRVGVAWVSNMRSCHSNTDSTRSVLSPTDSLPKAVKKYRERLELTVSLSVGILNMWYYAILLFQCIRELCESYSMYTEYRQYLYPCDSWVQFFHIYVTAMLRKSFDLQIIF